MTQKKNYKNVLQVRRGDSLYIIKKTESGYGLYETTIDLVEEKQTKYQLQLPLALGEKEIKKVKKKNIDYITKETRDSSTLKIDCVGKLIDLYFNLNGKNIVYHYEVPFYKNENNPALTCLLSKNGNVEYDFDSAYFDKDLANRLITGYNSTQKEIV